MYFLSYNPRFCSFFLPKIHILESNSNVEGTRYRTKESPIKFHPISEIENSLDFSLYPWVLMLARLYSLGIFFISDDGKRQHFFKRELKLLALVGLLFHNFLKFACF